jgi:hypothetical protein
MLQRRLVLWAASLLLSAAPAWADLPSENDVPECGIAPTYVMPEYEGCSKEQNEMLEQAALDAHAFVACRIAELDKQLELMKGPPAAPPGDKIQAAMKKHFKVPEHHKMVNYGVIVRGLRAGLSDVNDYIAGHFLDIKFSCKKSEDCDATWLAFVEGNPTTPDERHTTNLCPRFFLKSRALRAETVVHEASHLVLKTDDNAYYRIGEATPLDEDQSMTNADSWGNFAADPYP